MANSGLNPTSVTNPSSSDSSLVNGLGTAATAGLSAANDNRTAATNLNAANQDQNAALSALSGIYNVISQMLPPNLQQYAQPLAQLAYTGQYNVQDITAAVQQASALNGIKLNPQAMAAQVQALNQYQQIAEGSGFTPIERAGIAQTMNQIQSQNNGANAAIVQQNQMQGQGGVVNNLAARLLSQQNNNQNASLAGANIAAAGQQRAIGALSGLQQTGQSIAGQYANQANIEGQAQNAINQYNAGLKQQAATSNQTAQNQAAAQQQNINTNLEQQNVQNQLAGQQQEIGAASQQYGLGLQQTGQLSNIAGQKANVNTTFGMPYENTGLGAQLAGTQATNAGTGAAVQGGLDSLYNELTGGLSTSSAGGSTTLPSSSQIDALGNINYGGTGSGLNTGGDVKGPGTSTSDSIPAMLSDGEYVINAKQTSKYKPVIKAINDGAEPDEVASLLDRLVPPKKRRQTPLETLSGQ